MINLQSLLYLYSFDICAGGGVGAQSRYQFTEKQLKMKQMMVHYEEGHSTLVAMKYESPILPSNENFIAWMRFVHLFQLSAHRTQWKLL